METANNIVNQLLIPLMSTVLLGVASWLGVELKKKLEKKEKDKIISEKNFPLPKI